MLTAQDAVCAIVGAGTVLVGHSLHYDLRSLRLRHSLVIGALPFNQAFYSGSHSQSALP